MDRNFAVIHVATVKGEHKELHKPGRYVSKTPMRAAKKALSKICAKHAIKGACTLVITLKEITRGSDHKEYVYKVKRIVKPVVVERKDKSTTTFRYALTAERVKHHAKPVAKKTAKPKTATKKVKMAKKTTKK